MDDVLQDPRFQDSKFMDFVKKVSSGTVEFDEAGNRLVDRSSIGSGKYESAEWAEEFRAEGKSDWIHEFDNAPHRTGGPSAGWAEQFTNHEPVSTGDWASQFGLEQQETSEDWVRQMDEQMKAWSLMGAQARGSYQFASDNPFMEVEDRYQQGLDLFKKGYNHDAILAFEAEAQVNPKNEQAWLHLGLAHAESEEEAKAIQALEQCLELNPSNLQALTALSTSYANEAEISRSLHCLQNWIQHHSQYSSIHQAVVKDTNGHVDASGNYISLHDRVTEMFLRAARLNPASVDPDVQVALGLIYNLSGEYAKAIECFETALRVVPNDHTLWNKLGASLANSTPSRSEDAAGTYLKALEIKPLYPRAIANLGISYTNRGRHREAAEHYIGVLRLNPGATQLWDLLHIALTSMKRPDLASLTSERNIELFGKEFGF